MKPGVRKALLGVAIAAGILVIAAAVALWWALSTQSGARRLVALASSALKGSVSVERVEGRIRGPLTLHGLVYKTPALTVRVDKATIDWRVSELLRRRIDIVSLKASGVRVVSTPAPEKKARQSLPDLHLPFDIVIRQARVENLTFSSSAPSGGAPFRVDTIVLSTRATGGAIHVERLEARGPTFSADVSGSVRPQGPYPVDLSTRWSLKPAGGPPYSGSGRLTGTLQQLGVAQVLSTPFSARLDATLTDPLRDLRFRGDLTFEGVDARRLSPAAPQLVASGSLHAEGALQSFRARGRATARTDVANLGRVDAAWEIARDGEQWRIRRADFTLPDGSSVRASGTVRTASPAPLQFDVGAEWNRLSWPLTGTPTAASSHGNLRVRGTPDAYTVHASARVSGAGVPPGDWTLDGRGDPRRIQIASLVGRILSGTFSADGAVSWKPKLAWDLNVRGQGLDPSAIAASFPGRLNLQARTHGTLEPAGPSGTAELIRLAGTLRGQPVSGSALARFDHGRVEIPRASLRDGSAKLDLSARLGADLDVSWSAEVPSLSALADGVAGALTARGTVRGPREALRVQVSASGEGLAVGQRRVGSLTLAANVDMSPEGRSRVDLQAQRVTLAPGRPIDTVTLAAEGNLARHQITLNAAGSSPPLKFSAAVSGGLAPASSGTPLPERRWRGTLETLDLAARELTGRLERPAELSASAGAVSLDHFSWAVSGGRLVLSGAWSKDHPSELHASVEGVSLELLAPWLPPGVGLSGPLNGTVDARLASGGVVTGRVDLRPGPGQIRYLTAEDQTVSVHFQEAALNVLANSGGVYADASLTVSGSGSLSLSLALPDYNVRGVPEPAQRISGQFRANLSDVSWANAFVAAVENLRGSFQADVAFDGTIGNPQFRGSAGLSGAAADVPEYGLSLTDITLTASSDRGPLLHLDGRATSGGGTLSISGETPLAPSKQTPLKLQITGRRFQVMATAESRVWVSPDLTVVADGASVVVTGDVRVPEAKIEYAKKFATIPVSEDVVFVGQNPEPKTAGRSSAMPPIEAHVRLILGDRVEVQAEGFKGRITGSVLVTEAPNQPPFATGQLVIASGTYKAYGQDLTVEHGRIVFAGGAIDNPGVDLKAFRKANDGTIAGVIVKGTIRKPEVTLYSDPQMGQTETLAYILLGHPLGEASASEGNLVTSAATSLVMKGGNLLGKQLASKLGLETARIESQGGYREASIVIGKYLSPKLYVEYGLGLFNAVNTLRVRYTLSRHWTISAETGAENGADIFYTVEGGGTKRKAKGSDPKS
ncbi:MAG: translocation/assembly module TamB domain-containing protein [Acidobacteriota bacterium]